jgi:tRNA(Ile)-lysidine synthase
MASSRKSKRSSTVSAGSPLISCVDRHICNLVSAGQRLIVGLSGGIDSVVLLDMLSRIARRRHFHLLAVHVNHQISPHAHRWAKFCRALCSARAIPLRVSRVTVERGNSLEAAARAARLAVFRRLKGDFVVLAHNRDDQAETLLLQLLRGGGVKGLAAMPLLRLDSETKRREQGSGGGNKQTPILRPMLDVTRAQISIYAKKHKLKWIEDESNDNTYFPRNFLRHDVLPLIEKKYPAYRTVLARSTGHFAEAAQLLDELAAHDSVGCVKAGLLEVSGLRLLSHARAKNLLRYFLDLHGTAIPGAERLEEALRQTLTARNDARVCVDLGSFELRKYAGSLHVVDKTDGIDAAFARAWRGERRLALPELNGILTMNKCRDSGISLVRLEAAPVTIRVRRGGERLQPDCRRPHRSLKNLLQESGIPPWQRDRLPVIYCGKQPVWMPGVGIDCSFQARAGEVAIAADWQMVAA